MRFVLIGLVIALSSFSAHAENDEPFGIATVPALENWIGVNWRKVQDDWAVERKLIDHCRVERARCPSREALQVLGSGNLDGTPRYIR